MRFLAFSGNSRILNYIEEELMGNALSILEQVVTDNSREQVLGSRITNTIADAENNNKRE